MRIIMYLYSPFFFLSRISSHSIGYKTHFSNTNGKSLPKVVFTIIKSLIFLKFKQTLSLYLYLKTYVMFITRKNINLKQKLSQKSQKSVSEQFETEMTVSNIVIADIGDRKIPSLNFDMNKFLCQI